MPPEDSLLLPGHWALAHLGHRWSLHLRPVRTIYHCHCDPRWKLCWIECYCWSDQNKGCPTARRNRKWLSEGKLKLREFSVLVKRNLFLQFDNHVNKLLLKNTEVLNDKQVKQFISKFWRKETIEHLNCIARVWTLEVNVKDQYKA